MMDNQQNLIIAPMGQFPLLGNVPKIENYNAAVEMIMEKGIAQKNSVLPLNGEDLDVKIANL